LVADVEPAYVGCWPAVTLTVTVAGAEVPVASAAVYVNVAEPAKPLGEV
jgi:hypothetical protein